MRTSSGPVEISTACAPRGASHAITPPFPDSAGARPGGSATAAGCPDDSDHAVTAPSPPFEEFAVNANTLPSPDNALSGIRPAALVALAATEPSGFHTCTTADRPDCADEYVANR